MIENTFNITKYGKLYIKIINKYSNMEGKIESHHILPVSIYPEYKDLNKHIWNEARVSARVHFILHILLFKHYKKINMLSNEYISMVNAIDYMSKNGKYNSKYYNKFKSYLKRSDNHKLKIGKKLTQEYSIYNSKNEKVYSSNGAPFDEFCSINNLPFSQLRKSYSEKGKPIYLNKRGSNNVDKKIKEFFRHWYCLRNEDKRDKRYEDKDYIELLEYGTNKLVKVLDNSGNEIYRIKEYLLPELIINENMPSSFLKIGRVSYNSPNGLHKSKRDRKEKYYRWKTEYV